MKIVIIGDYNPDYPPHPATTQSLKHVEGKNLFEVQVEWLDTEKLNEPVGQQLANADGIWLGPAPYKSREGVRVALKYVRENNIPFIGTCGGLYQAIAEFVINVLKIDESLIEISVGDKSDSLFLRDTCCVTHGFSVIHFKTVENTKKHLIYPTEQCEEDSNCGFAVNPKYHSLLESHNFMIAGIDDGNEAKIFELSCNKFFLVTKFLPQMRSTPEMPHPLVEAFVKAALNN
jgi:CTP synthase (UTP-ammonia lyase)